MSIANARSRTTSDVWSHHEQYDDNMSRHSTNNSQPSTRPAPGMPPQTQSNGYARQKDNGMAVPGMSYRNGGGAPPPQMFDVARSPPGGPNKNTKHVPCKFFRQGQCQAGNACPFSHNIDPTTHQAPCKYFMKGNCKFGHKCALAHYLPDGRRVNSNDIQAGVAMAGRPPKYNNRPEPLPFSSADQAFNDRAMPPFGGDYFQNPGFPLDTDDSDTFSDRYSQYPGERRFDTVQSPPLSQYGSPSNDAQLPRSPVDNLRTALNAPMPQSFDSNGISHIARYGPLGQSAPDKYGIKSPPSSSLSRQVGSPPETGPYITSGLGSNLRNASPLASSPQNEESIGQRIMHSQKITKPRMISASVPRSTLYPDWEDGFGVETDLLPNSLHDEVLTPQEKMRRLSRPDQDTTGMTISSGTSSKVGSPPSGSSPSRFSHLWAEQREKKTAEPANSTLGQVGSPLRESWLPTESSSSQRGPQVSAISQQMARMQFGRNEPNEATAMRPPAARHASNPISRVISSPGLQPRRIDEEGEGVFFPMDDDKRSIISGASPRLAPLREKPNGEISRFKKDEGNARDGSLFGFR